MIVLTVIIFIWGYIFIRPLTPSTGFIYLNKDILSPEILNIKNRQIKIYRDDHGIPFINTQDENMSWFALGWLHAQDRLWQMEIFRHGAQGKLSFLFGKGLISFDYLQSFINMDRFLLTLGLYRIAKESIQVLDENEKRILNFYTDGINSYLKKYGGKLAPELQLLGYKPRPWRPEDSLAIIRFRSWQKENSLRKKILAIHLENISSSKTLPKKIVNQIYQLLISTSSINYPYNSRKSDVKTVKLKLGHQNHSDGSCIILDSKNCDCKNILMALNIQGNVERNHEMLYAASIESPTLKIQGITFPGVPAFISGRNPDIAWGINSLNLDTLNLRPLILKKINKEFFYFKDNWLPIKLIKERIFFPDSPIRDFENLNIFQTGYGPIITNAFNGLPETLKLKNLYALSWGGFAPIKEIGAFYKIARANSWKSFQEAFRDSVSSPAVAYFADKLGNIGARIIGKIPRSIISSGEDFPGFSGKDKKLGYKRGYFGYDELKSIFNPEKGYIIPGDLNLKQAPPFARETAPIDPDEQNQKASVAPADKKIFLNKSNDLNDYLNKFIENKIINKEKIKAEELMSLQTSPISMYARDFSREVLPYLSKLTTRLLKSPEKDALTHFIQEDPYTYQSLILNLSKWDGSFHKENVPGAIVFKLQLSIIRNILYNKLGETLTDEILKIQGLPRKLINFFIREGKEKPNSIWFDNFKTRKKKEDFKDIIRLSFYDTVFFLQKNFGIHLRNWRWGKLHKFYLRHPFESIIFGNLFFSKGPYPVSGFNSTMLNTYSLPFDRREISMASQTRLLFHGWNEPIFISMAGGQSGIPFSRHYFDMGRKWLNEEFIKLELNKVILKQKSLERLEIITLDY